MRWVIIGAGAVGGALAVALSRSGQRVAVVARGDHRRAIEERGLRLEQPGGARVARPPVIDIDELGRSGDDVALVCVKHPDAPPLLAQIDSRVPVVCVQNGVVGEVRAAGGAREVLGVMIWIPAVHLEPGVVGVYAERAMAFARVGAYPQGETELSRNLAAVLAGADVAARSTPRVMAWKRAKLICNLGNAADAFCDPGDAGLAEVVEDARREGRAVLDAAGAELIAPEKLVADAGDAVGRGAIAGRERPGGSTWQSATRGAALEVGDLNGYIAQLGDELGVPAPINRAFTQLVATGAPAPRSVSVASIRALGALCSRA